MCISNEHKESDVLHRPIIAENLDFSLWNDKCDYIEIEECMDLNPNNYNLTVIQLNIRSLLPKQTELNQLLVNLENRNSKVDLVLLCETFLNDQTRKFVNISSYKLYEDHHKNHKGVGTAILVRIEILSKKQLDMAKFVKTEIESTFIEITAKNGKHMVVAARIDCLIAKKTNSYKN